MSPPAFEIALIKPSTEQDRVIGMFTYPGGRVTDTNYTLKMLIHEAYAIEDHKILGGPHWTETDRYNLEAKPGASSTLSKWVPANFKAPPNPQMRRMLQTLLADRFQLKVHTETKKGSVYALVIAKGGPKLNQPRSTTAQPFVSVLPHGLSGQNATIDQLVERLGNILERPVANRTSIEGHFDFLIDYPPDSAGTDHIALLLSAIQDQIGLKLETRPGSVEMLVIDHVEKMSAN